MTLHIIPDWHDYSMILPEFNDSIHQAQLFLSQNQQVELILVDFLPNLRGILAEKNIEAVSTWSVYDFLQQIRLQAAKPLALMDFSWPAGAQFIDLPDRIIVRVADAHYATVWLDMLTRSRFERIDLMSDNQRIQELMIDDRGFVSRVTSFYKENHSAKKVDYLTPSGQVAMQQDLETGHVVTKQLWTMQTHFDNLSQVLAAALNYHLQHVPETDYLIFAQSQLTQFLVKHVSPQQPTIFSYQAQRTRAQLERHVLLEKPEQVDFSVVDTLKQSEIIVKHGYQSDDMTVIPPYVTDIKASSQATMPIVPIYWSAKELTVAVFSIVSQIVAHYSNVILLVETSQNHEVYDDMIEAASLSATNEHGLIDENSQQSYKARFQFLPPQNEASRQRYMSNVRLLIDLDDIPDHHLQATALTYGIPQINRVQTDYMVPEGNGQLVTNDEQIPTALHFYLDDYANVDKSRAVTIEMSQASNEEMLWIKWQQVFNKIKQGGHQK